MYFRHSGEIWRDFPALVPAVLYADRITSHAEVEARVDRFAAVAKARLADGPEGELPEIQAWRRAFAQMGLKPTQYRCVGIAAAPLPQGGEPAAAAPAGRPV